MLSSCHHMFASDHFHGQPRVNQSLETNPPLAQTDSSSDAFPLPTDGLVILFHQTRVHSPMFDATNVFSYLQSKRGEESIECDCVKKGSCTLRGCQDLLSPSYCGGENNDDEG